MQESISWEYQEDPRDQALGRGEERVPQVLLEEQNAFAEDPASGHVLEFSGGEMQGQHSGEEGQGVRDALVADRDVPGQAPRRLSEE